IYAQTGGWNINWVRITKAAGARTALAAKNSAESGLEVYPNPATSQLHVVSKLNLAGSRYSLVDARGRQVGSGTLEKGSVNVADLKTGIYQLIITTKDEQQITRRFAK
ncbi:T9SS type A sorting domain-containing protein, partial [Hymenobacter guriensis]